MDGGSSGVAGRTSSLLLYFSLLSVSLRISEGWKNLVCGFPAVLILFCAPWDLRVSAFFVLFACGSGWMDESE